MIPRLMTFYRIGNGNWEFGFWGHFWHFLFLGLKAQVQRCPKQNKIIIAFGVLENQSERRRWVPKKTKGRKDKAKVLIPPAPLAASATSNRLWVRHSVVEALDTSQVVIGCAGISLHVEAPLEHKRW